MDKKKKKKNRKQQELEQVQAEVSIEAWTIGPEVLEEPKPMMKRSV